MLSTPRVGRSALGALARGSRIKSQLVTNPSVEWARHASSYRYPKGPRRRVFKPLAIFGLSAAAVAAYPAVFKKQEEYGPQSAQAPPAEIVVERTRKQANSLEDSRALLSSQHLQVKKSWERPGVYAWGLNSGRVAAPDSKETYIKTPRRIPYFDGQLLRDVKLDRELGAAVTESGDLVQWGTAVSKTSAAPVVTLKGKDLVKVALSQDRIMALSASGAVYSLPGSQSEGTQMVQSEASSRFPLWSSPSSSQSVLCLKPENLGWGEKVVDISSGREHCLMLTSRGRVFSAASSAEGFPSQGQLGIPGLRWDNRPSGPYCRPHEILGLGKSKIVKIATGDFHSLVLDSEGRVYAFGNNSAGQLGIPTETGTPFLDVPSPIPIERLYNGTGLIPHVTTIAAGGLNSFFTVDAAPVPREKGSTDLVPVRQRMLTADVWACGEGIYGNLGTGKWTHGHPSTEPTKIKSLSNLYEFDEKTNQVVPIRLSHVSVGTAHASAVMQNLTNVSASERSGNDTNWGADVMLWGHNESYQLGTGKRNNENVPVYIGPLDGGKGDAEKGRKGETHRLQITPRKTVRLGEDGKGRRVSVEQRIECGRDVSAVYSGT